MSGQLEPLGFSAAKGVDRLAEAKVVKADVRESFERPGDAIAFAEKGESVAHGHLQHIMDGPASKPDLQDMRLEASPFTLRTPQIEVAQKLHLHLLEADT